MFRFNPGSSCCGGGCFTNSGGTEDFDDGLPDDWVFQDSAGGAIATLESGRIRITWDDPSTAVGSDFVNCLLDEVWEGNFEISVKAKVYEGHIETGGFGAAYGVRFIFGTPSGLNPRIYFQLQHDTSAAIIGWAYSQNVGAVTSGSQSGVVSGSASSGDELEIKVIGANYEITDIEYIVNGSTEHTQELSSPYDVTTGVSENDIWVGVGMGLPKDDSYVEFDDVVVTVSHPP